MKSQKVTTAKRLIHNTISNIVMRLVTAVVNFCLIEFFLDKLGVNIYGVWILVGSIFSYRDMLSMGLNSSINRHIPVCLAHGDKAGIKKVISTALFFYACLSLVLLTASVLVSRNIGAWFDLPPELSHSAAVLVLTVGFCYSAAMPLQLFSAILSGLQRYDIVNLVLFAVLIIRTALLVAFLSWGYGLVTMGLIFGLSEVGIRLMLFIIARRLIQHFSISLKNVDFRLLKEMLTYGFNTLLYTMGALLIYKTSDIIIGVFISTAEVSKFFIAVTIVLFLSQLVKSFSAAIKPEASDLDARNDRRRLQEMSFLAQKYILLLLIPSVCFLVVMGRDFLSIWVGDKFTPTVITEELGVVLTILAVGHSIRLSQHSNFMVLVGIGDHKIFGVFTGIMAVLCIVLSIISVTVLDMGLVGIAWANFLPMVLISGIALPLYFNWKMGIAFRENLLQVWWPSLRGCLPSIVVICIWKQIAAPDSWMKLGAVVAIAGGITIISCWFFSMSKIEQGRLSGIIFRRKTST